MLGAGMSGTASPAKAAGASRLVAGLHFAKSRQHQHQVILIEVVVANLVRARLMAE